MSDALTRLKDGYYNSDDVTEANPGGLGDDGHETNLPSLLVDVGTVAQQVGLDAAAVATHATSVGFAASAVTTMLVDVNNAKDTAVGAAGFAVAAAAGVSLPSILPGDGGKVLAVKSDESGHELIAPRAALTHTHVAADVTGTLAQGKHTIWMPASAMVSRSTAGAGAGRVETPTNKVVVSSLDFDAATVEYAQFTVAMPKSWDRGTVTFQALWTAASGTGGVAFSLAAVAIGDDDALDAAPGTAITVTDTLITANDLHVTGESGAVTIAGSPAQGDMVVFQLARQVANASDTLAVDARLIGLRLFVTLTAGNDA